MDTVTEDLLAAIAAKRADIAAMTQDYWYRIRQTKRVEHAIAR